MNVNKLDLPNKLIKFKQTNIKNYSLYVLFINILFFTLISYILPIKYEANDDVLMCMIANGLYGGEPDCHLVFINAILGQVLSYLYNLSTSIEWYTLCLSTIQVVSVTVIICLIIYNQYFTTIYKILIGTTIYLYWIQIIVAFQFTTTASIAAFAGCILLINGNKSKYILSIILLIISAMIRFESTVLIIILFSPLFIKIIINNTKYLILFSTLAILIFSLPIIDKLFYSSTEWKEYKEYNFYRGKINDNPNSYRVYKDLPENITVEDYNMFLNCIGDGEIFTTEKVKSIYDTLINQSFETKLKYIKNIKYSQRHFIPILIILLLFFFNLHYIQHKYNKYYLSIIMLLFMGIFIFITLNADLKDRVFLSMLLPVLYTIIVFTYDSSKQYRNILIILVLLCLVSNYSINSILNNRNHNLTNSLIKEQQELLKRTNSFVYNIDYGIAMQNAWHIKDLHIKPVALGWLTHIPLSNKQLLSYKDFIDNDIVVFTKLTNKSSIKIIQDYLFNKYNIITECNIVEISENYALYKLKRKALDL